MEIERLYEFLVLSEHLNYSKAANQLYLTQPVLSRHIHDLEKQIGASLLIRDTHNVRLTPIGVLFTKEAKEITDKYEEALARVKNATRGLNGVLYIGFLEAAVKPFLSKFVLKFSEDYPNIKLDFYSNNLDEIITNINNDTIDIGFVTHVETSVFYGLESKLIFRDKLTFAVSKDNPLAARESITVKELSDFPMISLAKESNPTAHEFHKTFFKKYKSKYNSVKEVPNVETALFFVSLNKGGFLMPKHLSGMATDLAVLKFEEEDFFIDLNLIWKKSNPNPATMIFCKEFFEFMHEMKE